MNAANMSAKQQADVYKNAKRVYQKALNRRDAEALERAAEAFEKVGATAMAARARDHAAALQKGTNE